MLIRKKTPKKTPKETSKKTIQDLTQVIEPDNQEMQTFNNQAYDAYFELLLICEAKQNAEGMVGVLSRYWVDYIDKAWEEFDVAHMLSKGCQFVDVQVFKNILMHFSGLESSCFFKLGQNNSAYLYEKMAIAYEQLSQYVLNDEKILNLTMAKKYYQKAIESNPEKEPTSENENLNVAIKEKNGALTVKVNTLEQQLVKFTPGKKRKRDELSLALPATQNTEVPTETAATITTENPEPPTKKPKLEISQFFKISHINNTENTKKLSDGLPVGFRRN